MKLSEAIRAGAKLRPQAFFMMFDGVGSCALGAAYEAVTGKVLDDFFVVSWSLLGLSPGVLDHNLWKAITEMNDKKRMTREEIADWVEEQERKQGLWRESDEAYTKRVLGEIEKSADLVAA